MSGPAILSESSSAPATRSGDLLMCPLGLPGQHLGEDPLQGNSKPESREQLDDRSVVACQLARWNIEIHSCSGEG